MLRKLLKHEFRATGRIGLPLCLGMIALSVLASVALTLLNRDNVSDIVNTVSVIVVMLYVLGFFALTIGTVIVVVERFYKSVLRDEGYLTLTLPCSLAQVLSARLICALVWYLVAALICCVAVLVILAANANAVDIFRGVGDFINLIWNNLPKMRGEDVLWIVSALLELIVLVALVCLQVTLHFYASMAIGHSFHKSKILLSVVAFFVISWIFNALALGGVIGGWAEDLFSFDGDWSTQLALGTACLATLVTDAVLYAVTHLCLKYKLNLE